MRIPIFQVDAFAAQRFLGNPAAVIPMDRFLADATLQSIAAENNLAETAFLVPAGGDYRLRWFTPTNEVPLCGHATLASAAVVMERLEPRRSAVVFHSASGPLTVRRIAAGYVMDFPQRPCAALAPPPGLAAALGVVPVEICADQSNFLVLLESAQLLRSLAPDIPAIARLDRGGVIVTAPGDGGYDFISRYFAPAKGIPEDPVTGSAHCMLAPYWAKRFSGLGSRRADHLPAHRRSHRAGRQLRVLSGRAGRDLRLHTGPGQACRCCLICLLR
jgi:PhzF family phenazine biosynthesis protein